jgi:hypothetical protein
MAGYTGTAYPTPPAADFVSGSHYVAPAQTFEMRGKVAGNFVYWISVGIDSTGAQYPGPGTPTDIVVLYRYL